MENQHETTLRLICEGREEFALKYVSDAPKDSLWEILSDPDSNISRLFEMRKDDIKSVGTAYEIIMNTARTLFDGSEYQVELTQTGSLSAEDTAYSFMKIY